LQRGKSIPSEIYRLALVDDRDSSDLKGER